jgi:hypothetical protein
MFGEQTCRTFSNSSNRLMLITPQQRIVCAEEINVRVLPKKICDSKTNILPLKTALK